MATRIEPITLPWKRPEKGVSAAELGASFRVEQREDGWHCTVRVGRRAEVLATGLRRLRDAQCRAEAHAATLPEVIAAKAETEAAKPAAKGGRKGAVRAAAPVAEVRASEPAPSPAEEVAPAQPPVRAERRPRAPTFVQVSDGCICGKIEGGTWVADPAGKVSVPEGTDPAVAQEICRVAAKHYAAQRQKATPGGTAKPAPKAAAKPPADAAPVDSPRRAGKGKRSKSKAARKRLAAKLAAKPRAGAKTAAEPEVETTARAAKKTTARAAKKTTAGAAKKTTARAAKKTTARAAKKTTARAAKQTAGAEKTATASAARKTTARTTKKPTARTATASAAKKPTARTAVQVAAPTDAAPAKRGSPRKDDPAVAQTEAKEASVGKKTGKTSKCGCVTWTEAGGKARGEAKHGAFVVEPEGKRHALYFYDPDGQSRHLQSGEAGKLRKVAEEMAARGQPAPRTAASATDDAALMRAFMGGAMEDEA